MRLVARTVLDDCREALAELNEDPLDGRWRRRLVTVLALLRAVGHVLHEVDGKRDPRLQAIIRQHWNHPPPSIFSDFIKRERDSILKEYRTNAGLGVTVRPGTVHLDLKTGEQTMRTPSRPNLYDYTMKAGTYKGRDQRHVAQEAIDWWESHLSRIESEFSVLP
jgi:hypothetical protein